MLDHTFVINSWLLLVIVVTSLLIVREVPTLVILVIGIFIAGLCTLFIQHRLLSELTEGEKYFKGLLIVLYSDTYLITGHELLSRSVEDSVTGTSVLIP